MDKTCLWRVSHGPFIQVPLYQIQAAALELNLIQRTSRIICGNISVRVCKSLQTAQKKSLPLFSRLHQQCGFRRLLFTIHLQTFGSTFIARFMQPLRWLFVFSVQSKNSRFGKCHSGKNSSAISWTRTGSGIVLPAISETAVVGYFNDKPEKQLRLKSKQKDWIIGQFWTVILFHVLLKPTILKHGHSKPERVKRIVFPFRTFKVDWEIKKSRNYYELVN